MENLIETPFFGKPESITLSELFHENTKLQPETAAWTNPMPAYTTSEIHTMSKAYKQYSLAKTVQLPPHDAIPKDQKGFDEIIENRRTVREFSDSPLAINELSRVLYQTYGMTKNIPMPGGGTQPLRAAPSGGALYPAEIYLGVNKVEGLDAGMYHYNVPHHRLELMKSGDHSHKLFEVCIEQPQAKEAGVVFLISAVLNRTKHKYGERGYRYILLDIGHLGQNLYLACSALGLAVMTTCGFYDDEANKLLQLDGNQETVMYAGFIGNKSKVPK
jgi:SagB-type dehydrogenase family enzyme